MEERHLLDKWFVFMETDIVVYFKSETSVAVDQE